MVENSLEAYYSQNDDLAGKLIELEKRLERLEK